MTEEEHKRRIDAAERYIKNATNPEDRRQAMAALLQAIRQIEQLEAERGGPLPL
ncbi:hypothetical protein ACQR1I_14235 [Bradyrhizobium sp. HKCCYLS2038]|uniref:hypothetical protein n=1 Tax=unclassified Bradyrhizobium TaxID=2631580 RepID=UPI003EBB3640